MGLYAGEEPALLGPPARGALMKKLESSLDGIAE
jgi:hypothetical protein